MTVAEAIKHIRPSIVQITYLASDFSDEFRRQIGGKLFISGPLGTGFLANSDGYVITALHVITEGRMALERLQAGRKEMFVGLATPNTETMRGNFTLVHFELIDEDPLHDLALLKLRRNPFEGEVKSGFRVAGKEIPLLFGVASLKPQKPQDGAAVAISGFPLGQPVLVTNAGWMATTWSYNISQIHPPGAPDWFRMPDIADSYLADVQANPGNSGGPVYLIENGLVIGVCLASKTVRVQQVSAQGEHEPATTEDGRPLVYASGLTVVVPAQYLIDLLKKNGLKWTETE